MLNQFQLQQQWRWTPEVSNQLRFPFENADAIKGNFSQSWQDIFVLSILQGKYNGSYLEIGAQQPYSCSNTALLNQTFGWDGVSVELDPIHFPDWQLNRQKSKLIIADALSIDYNSALPMWFGGANRIDYLQLDIDPSRNTLRVLELLPLDTWRFSVVTFETDSYAGDLYAQKRSREILKHYGYELIAENVCVLFTSISSDPIPFEDWWVDPRVVDKKIIDDLKSLALMNVVPQDFLFKY